MWFLSVTQLAVAAWRFRFFIAILRAVFVQVATRTPQATGRLLTVCPDMAEILAVVTLRQTSLRFISLYLVRDMAEACKFKDLLGYFRSG
jgi:hypothetical protein